MRQKMNVNPKAFQDKRDLTRHKVNQGDNVYRILPPFGEQADGYPYKRWSLSWMLDPSSGNRRPYASLWSFGNDSCPIGQYTKALQTKREELELKFAASGLDKEEIKNRLKPITETLYEIKPKSSFFYNAVNKSGQVGVLELKKSAHDSLKKVMSQYVNDYGCDPTSLNSNQDDSGLWLKITRTGVKLDTEYSVEKNQAKVKDPNTGRMMFEDDRSELPTNVVNNYEDLAIDLFKLYRELSYYELKDVLLFNISKFHSSFKSTMGDKAANLIIVPGFEIAEVTESGNYEPSAKQTNIKTKVMTKFEDDDNNNTPWDDEPVVVSNKSAIKNTKSAFDLAEDILS